MTDVEKLRLRSDLGIASSSLARLFRMTGEMDPDTMVPEIERSVGDVVDRLRDTLRMLEGTR